MSERIAFASEPESDRQVFASQRAAIDASARLPVLGFLTGSVFWLLAGTVLALLASIKLHNPEFLDNAAWLTFGRVRSAHLNTMAYGWASQAGIGVLLWLMARLARAELCHTRLLILAVVVWNLGMLAGTTGLLAGEGNSIEWLEFPPFAPPFFAIAFALIAVSAMVTFRNRREPHVYVTQWYLIGAVFWFPWLYTAANLLLLYAPVSGVAQASINWWYAHNVLGLWLTPIGLGAAYYLLPKVLGRPIYSYQLSLLGFWSLALFYNWAGVLHLIGGPLPAWLITLSIVGSGMMVIPVITVAINHHMTVVGNFRQLRYSPTLRFIVFGAMSYTVVSVQGALQSLRTVNEVTHFTHYTVAHAHLGVYAFFTMIMFGSIYYIVPRLTGWEWASGRLISFHFWTTAVGVALYFLALTFGGWWQGLEMNNADVPFLTIVQHTLPYLQARSVAGLLMAAGHLTFAVLFALNLLHIGTRRRGPTLFVERPREADLVLADAPAGG
jgi:cytochrome c oxidase cbb3-type subunit 1